MQHDIPMRESSQHLQQLKSKLSLRYKEELVQLNLQLEARLNRAEQELKTALQKNITLTHQLLDSKSKLAAQEKHFKLKLKELESRNPVLPPVPTTAGSNRGQQLLAELRQKSKEADELRLRLQGRQEQSQKLEQYIRQLEQRCQPDQMVQYEARKQADLVSVLQKSVKQAKEIIGELLAQNSQVKQKANSQALELQGHRAALGQISQFQKKFGQIFDEARTLKFQNYRLKAVLQEKGNVIEVLESESLFVGQALASQQKTTQRLKSDLGVAALELNQRKERLTISEQSLKEAQAQLEQLKRETSKSQTQNSALKESLDQMAARIQELKAELDSKKQAAQDYGAASATALKALQSKCQAQRGKYVQCKLALDSAESKSNSLRQSLEQHKQKLEVANRLLSQSRRKVDEKEQQLMGTKEKHRQHEKQISYLQGMVKTVKDENQSLKQLLKECKSRSQEDQRRIEGLAQKLNELKNLKKNSDSKDTYIEKLKQEQEQLLHQNSKLSQKLSEIDRKSKRLQHENGKANNSLQALTLQLKEKSDRIAAQQRSLGQYSNIDKKYQQASKANQALQQEVQILKSQLQSRGRAKKKLEDELEKAEFARANLENQVPVYERQVGRLKKELQSATYQLKLKSTTLLSESQSKYKLKETAIQLSAQLLASQASCADSNSKIRQLEAKSDSLLSQVDKRKRMAEQQQGQISRLKQLIDKLKAAFANETDLATKNRQLQASLNRVRNQRRQFQARASEKEQQASRADELMRLETGSKIKLLQKVLLNEGVIRKEGMQFESLVDAVAIQLQRDRESAKQNEQLQRQALQLGRRVASLGAQNMELKSQKMDLQSSLSKVEERLGKTDFEYKKCKREAEGHLLKTTQLQQDRQQLVAQLVKLEAKGKHLERCLEAARRQAVQQGQLSVAQMTELKLVLQAKGGQIAAQARRIANSEQQSEKQALRISLLQSQLQSKGRQIQTERGWFEQAQKEMQAKARESSQQFARAREQLTETQGKLGQRQSQLNRQAKVRDMLARQATECAGKFIDMAGKEPLELQQAVFLLTKILSSYQIKEKTAVQKQATCSALHRSLNLEIEKMAAEVGNLRTKTGQLAEQLRQKQSYICQIKAELSRKEETIVFLKDHQAELQKQRDELSFQNESVKRQFKQLQNRLMKRSNYEQDSSPFSEIQKHKMQSEKQLVKMDLQASDRICKELRKGNLQLKHMCQGKGREVERLAQQLTLAEIEQAALRKEPASVRGELSAGKQLAQSEFEGRKRVALRAGQLGLKGDWVADRQLSEFELSESQS